jgi:DNA-binding transcriptional LysR family regulator
MARLDNRITLQKLEIFVLVADLGGVGRAAERLYVAQPVVTQHLRDLADRVGAPLFTRNGRAMTLTPAGQAVYHWATETLARAGETARELREIADGTRGHVSVGASMTLGSYVLPDTLVQFTADRPNVHVELHVTDSDSALRAVADGRCDFAVAAADSVSDSGEFDIVAASSQELVLVAARSSDVGDTVSAAALGEVAFVCSSREMSRRTTIDTVLAQRGIHRSNVVLEVNNPEAVKRAVRAGAGVAFLMRSAVADELAAGLLRAIKVDGLGVTVPVRLVKRKGRSLTPIQDALLSLVVTAVAAA